MLKVTNHILFANGAIINIITITVIDFHWVSNYEFIAAYAPHTPPDSKSGGVPPSCKVISITVEVSHYCVMSISSSLLLLLL